MNAVEVDEGQPAIITSQPTPAPSVHPPHPSSLVLHPSTASQHASQQPVGQNTEGGVVGGSAGGMGVWGVLG